MSDPAQLKSIERTLDAEYEASFPGRHGWESGALLLLFGHNAHILRSMGWRHDPWEDSKYGLMHALRWGRTIRSQPIDGIPQEIRSEDSKQARLALRRGLEYLQIFDAFMMYYEGVIPLVSVTTTKVEFGPNSQWRAFDVLDLRLRECREQQVEPTALATTMLPCVDELLQGARSGGLWNGSGCLPARAVRSMMASVRKSLLPAYELPDEWHFCGMPIDTLRRSWGAMVVLARIHQRQAAQLYPRGKPHYGRLMIWPRTNWTAQLEACAQLDKRTAEQIIELHTYGRQHSPPDIGITPLLPIGGDVLATDPWLILSSSPERNFLAHVAREHKESYDSESNLLSIQMASELAVAFEGAGFRAGKAIPIKTSMGNTDIDLLVWSPAERYVLTAELKWLIAPADFVEVMNRGVKTAERSLDVQLPKHAAALRADAASLVTRAFNLRADPQIDDHASILIMRGFVGSPRIRRSDFSFIVEQMLRMLLGRRPTLRQLVEWCKSMDYLPCEGKDYSMQKAEIVSPSGLVVAIWGCYFKL